MEGFCNRCGRILGDSAHFCERDIVERLDRTEEKILIIIENQNQLMKMLSLMAAHNNLDVVVNTITKHDTFPSEPE